MSRKELFICDGIEGTPHGAVLVEEHDGFVITGTIMTTLTGAAQKTLLQAGDGAELALCRQCFCAALGLPLEAPKR
jgi:hypothetical protein